MSRPGQGRTQPCTKAHGRTRLAEARAFLDQAQLADTASTGPEQKAAVSSAVLAGIAAADAACCAALGRRSRSQDHRDAVAHLGAVPLGGGTAARNLERLLAMKDGAQYGLEPIGGRNLVAATRLASGLVEFADQVVSR